MIRAYPALLLFGDPQEVQRGGASRRRRGPSQRVVLILYIYYCNTESQAQFRPSRENRRVFRSHFRDLRDILRYFTSHAMSWGMKRTNKRRGRPPGTGKLGRLLHVRITDDLSLELDEISGARRDAPNTTTMVREALALYVETQKASLKLN